MLSAIKRLLDSCFCPDKDLAALRDLRMLHGVETTRYPNGMISSYRDTSGRAWQFTYAGGKVVRFTDPSGSTWCEEHGRWHGFDIQGRPLTASRSLVGISVNQESGEVTLHGATKKTIYRTDGTTCYEFEEERNGRVVQMSVTEYATIPSRTKVAIEKSAGGDLLKWIEDANGRVYRFDYEGNRLVSYIDISPLQSRKWLAQWEGGVLVRWVMQDAAQVMTPHLESVDLRGNRYYTTAEGRSFVVKPNGAAYAQSIALAAG